MSEQIIDKKRCTSFCGEEKSLGCFPIYRARGREYRANRCKDCRREYNKRFIAKNPDKAKEYGERAKVWRKEHPEIVKEWDSKKYQKHKPKILVDRKSYYEKNKDKIQARDHEWRERNREYLREEAKKYHHSKSDEVRAHDRIRSRAARFALKMEALRAYGGAFCCCCNETAPEMLTLDHKFNDGNVHRKSGEFGKISTQMYRWARRNDWPPIFVVRCFNCNIARVRTPGNVCPHEIERLKLAA